MLAGTLRLVQLLGGPELIPADHRFAGFPLPLVVHIVGASAYAVVGAFQFVPRFRRQHPGWHRGAGRVLVVAGLLVAGSALWMTLFYAPQPGTGSSSTCCGWCSAPRWPPAWSSASPRSGAATSPGTAPG